MKTLLIILWSAVGLASCNEANKEIGERISNSDSVAINYFKGDGTMDTVVAIKIIKDKKKLEQLADLISAQTADAAPKCGFDGSLHFFKMNQVIQDIDFRINDDNCMYFSFLQAGKLQATILSNEAKELINSFRKQ